MLSYKNFLLKNSVDIKTPFAFRVMVKTYIINGSGMYDASDKYFLGDSERFEGS